MTQKQEDMGASPDGDRAGGLRPEPAAQSQPKALIPSAEERIMAILTTTLEPMQTQGMDWQRFYRWMRAKPDEIVSRLRDSGVLFRLAEQADWPVVAEMFDAEPYGFRQTIRMQVTIGGQTFGAMETAPFAQYAGDPGYVQHVAGQMVRAVIAYAAKPFEEEAHRQISRVLAQGTETAKPPRREAGLARKGESPVGNADAPTPSHPGDTHNG